VSPLAGRPVPPSKQHALELDTLRAIAIASVLFHHFLPDSSILNRMQRHLQEGAAFGVPLFFALSGFLITRILVQSRGTVEAGKTTSKHALYIFYARRFLRIFPVYYATLFVGALLKFNNVRAALPWHLAYLSNFYYFHRGSFDRGPAPVFWTLSVEEQFYLIWPIIFVFLPLRRLSVITLFTAVIGGIFSAWGSDRGSMVNLLLPAHLSYLALGSYLGLAGTAPIGSIELQERAMRRFLIAIPLFVLGALVFLFALPRHRTFLEISNGLRYFSTALAFAWVVARLSKGVSGPLGTILRWRPLTYIGRISYGMYVVQFFVSSSLDRLAPRVAAHLGKVPAEWLLKSFPARVVAIVAVASLSWFLLEKPLNDLKRRFPYIPPARMQT
jgi:peptidoglycan/LPS O-acetylase OafA/YrhL